METINNNIKLSKSPIIDTTLEIVCSFKIPTEVVLGVFYNSLLKSGVNVIGVGGLPILGLPEIVREKDENLKDKPTHKIDCDKGIIAIGPRIISISFIPPYKSWAEYVEFIGRIIGVIKELDILKDISSVNLRYLNFFRENVFESIKLAVVFNGEPIIGSSTILKTELPSLNGNKKVLQITNSVHVKNVSLGLDDDGSLIDITVVSKNNDLENLLGCIENSHKDAKELFYSLLKQEFVEKFI